MFALQTAITTSTCIADYLSWSDYSNTQKMELGKLYVPYLALCKSIPASTFDHISLSFRNTPPPFRNTHAVGPELIGASSGLYGD